MIRKQYLRLLTAVLGISTLGLAAKGQTVDQIKVDIPYQFVVDGKTLPAGTYTVRRVFDRSEGALILNNFENHTGVIILPRSVESASVNQSSVRFDEVGGRHFLSEIKTANHVFIIPASRMEIMQATAKPQSAPSAAGSSAGASAGSN